MRDVDHTDALCLQITHDLEELLNLKLSQSRSGLVQDQNLCVTGDRLGDLNHLLLSDGQSTEGSGGIDLDANALEKLSGILLHLLIVDEAVGDRLAADVDVLCDGQVIHHVQFLMDHTDTGVLGFLNVGEVDRLAVQDDLAFVSLMDAGKDLHKCRLTCAVLAHQSVYLATSQLEINALECMHTVEALMYSRHFEQYILH